jgi:transcriptional regulator with XRE-family HTH domain
MAITDQEMGRRLRAARKACGMTQAEAARELGLSRATVARMESGSRMAHAIELEHLAFLYGRAALEFFADEFLAEAPSSAVLRSTMVAPCRDETLALLRTGIALGHELRNLQKLLRLPPGKDDEFGAALRQQVVELGLEALRREEITRAKFLEVAELAGVPPETQERLVNEVFPEGDIGDLLIPAL